MTCRFLAPAVLHLDLVGCSGVDSGAITQRGQKSNEKSTMPPTNLPRSVFSSRNPSTYFRGGLLLFQP